MHAILMSRLEDLWREIKKGDEEMRAQGKERGRCCFLALHFKGV